MIHATTQGGPAQSTNILVYKVYIDGFVGLDLGSSAAQSVILMVIVIALTVIQFRYIERRVEYSMVENRPFLTFLAHLVLILGVAIVVFPVYVAFIASTQGAGEFLSGAIPLLPGGHMLDNYRAMLGIGMSAAGRAAARADAVQQPGDGALDRHRQDRHLDPVGLRHRLLPLSVPRFFFWLIFVTLMLPVEVRIIPTYEVVAEPRACSTATPAFDPADRLGHRHLPVPPVLHDRARRADGGGAGRRRRTDEVLPRHPAAALAAPTSPRSS